MLSLYSPLSALKGCGPKKEKELNKLGIFSISELLRFQPLRYQNFGPSKKISQIPASGLVRITARIDLIANRRSFKKRTIVTEALVKDQSGSLKVLWFNQAFTIKNLQPGDIVSLAGKIGQSYGQKILLSPQYEKIDGRQSLSLPFPEIIPLYSLSGNLKQKQIRLLIKQCLPLVGKIKEYWPNEILQKMKLPTISQTLTWTHLPQNENQALEAKKRLLFDLLFIQQIKNQISRRHQALLSAPKIPFSLEAIQKFIASLPFKLTADQKKVSWEIIKDTEKTTAMQRIVQGDVGSGKTVVAAIAALNVMMAGKQCLLMAPTEILAKQHYDTLKKLLGEFSPPMGLLTSAVKKSEKNKIAKEALLIIGTSALIQEGLEYNDPALVIVDEQHRFGVAQRKKLQKRKEEAGVHFLSLSATPIPRSLALAIYGEVDLSIIKEKPAGRKEVKTMIVAEDKREKMYHFASEEMKKGHQVYLICPLVEESETLESKSAITERDRLQKEVFPEFRIGLLHGQMKSADKNKNLEDFLTKKIDLLVSTSVVEVGMDNPWATIIIIEGAERFGLAQLHQFRGRVGRGDDQSYCFLCPHPEKENNHRLQALEKHHDGFQLAKIDLQHRGAGSLYGLEQSGFKEMEIASLFSYVLLQEASLEAQKIVNQDPELEKYPLIKEKLEEFEKDIHWE